MRYRPSWVPGSRQIKSVRPRSSVERWSASRSSSLGECPAGGCPPAVEDAGYLVQPPSSFTAQCLATILHRSHATSDASSASARHPGNLAGSSFKTRELALAIRASAGLGKRAPAAGKLREVRAAPPCRRLRAAAAASPATDRILVTTPQPRVRSRGPTAVVCWARESRTAGRWHGMAAWKEGGRPPWNPVGCCSCCRGASPKIERHRPRALLGSASQGGGVQVFSLAGFFRRALELLFLA